MTAFGFKRILAILLSSSLAGCFVPMRARDVPQARANVGEAVPEAIVVGKATRADVLLALGEPDGTDDHEGKFVYTAIRGQGGLSFFGIRGGFDFEKRTYRRLVVTFDDAGTVRDARIETNSCWGSDSYSGTGGDTHGQCVDVTGQDLPPADGVHDPRLAEDLAQGREITSANWWPEGGSAVLGGRLVVGASHVILLRARSGAEEAPLVAIEYAQIADVRVESFGLS